MMTTLKMLSYKTEFQQHLPYFDLSLGTVCSQKVEIAFIWQCKSIKPSKTKTKYRAQPFCELAVLVCVALEFQ